MSFRSNIANIAILPTNTTIDDNLSPSSPVELVDVEIPQSGMADYSDKSFVVFGEATRKYITQLKSLGGKFNGKLKEKPGFSGGSAWIFYMKLKPQVTKFINQINTEPPQDIHLVQNMQNRQDGQGINLPTVITPMITSNYQNIRWKVFKPSAGMLASIKANGVETTGEVIQIETHKDIVDTAYIRIGENNSKLVICNGKWAVYGYMVDHTVFFSEKVTI